MISLTGHAQQVSNPSFVLKPQELKSFEGYYQFERNSSAFLKLTAKENGLVAKQLWDDKEFFIVPKSELEFYSPKEHFPATFTKDSNGKVVRVLVFQKDTWKKVPNYTERKTITLSPDQLKKYEGKYSFQFQPGQDAFIQISAKEDHLLLTENWTGNQIKFLPLSELDFYNKERTFPLKFIKDSNGAITKVLAFERDLWTRVKP